MHSTFSNIELGKRGLQAHEVALSVVGHNLANASTEGYSRQRVKMHTTDPLYVPDLTRVERAGQLGTGVEVASIERVRDELIDRQIFAQNDDFSYWETRELYLREIDSVYQETDNNSIRKVLDEFWHSWQNLANSPDTMDSREEAFARGENLMNSINLRFQRLDDIRQKLNNDIIRKVQELNQILDNIGSLNRDIVRAEAVGDNPNDLYDRRDLLTEKLSSYLSISTDGRDPDEFQIHTGGRHLIQGRVVKNLATVANPNNESLVDVVWPTEANELVQLKVQLEEGGTIAALVKLRDQDLRSEIQKLDKITINYSSLVNEIHRDAFALNSTTGHDFFQTYPDMNNTLGNYDSTGDGNFDSTRIFRMSGINDLDPHQQIGIAGLMQLSAPDNTNISINYFPTDTVADLIERINNSEAEIVARLDRNNRLELRATESKNLEVPDFIIRHVEDDGYFLTQYAGLLNGTGAGGAFDWQTANQTDQLRQDGASWQVSLQKHPANWMQVADSIKKDKSNISVSMPRIPGQDAAIGDNQAALAIAALSHEQVMLGHNRTFADFFADSIANIGELEHQATLFKETNAVDLKFFRDMRESVSGVDTDEEFSNMIKFQHGYNAAARFVSTVDEMLDLLINRMGV